MKIRDEYKVREIAGEHVVIMQGRYGADMTKVISLNESSLFLWNELAGREFCSRSATGSTRRRPCATPRRGRRRSNRAI